MRSGSIADDGVSVAICSYNGRARLSETLTHLAHQVVPPDIRWELVFVDNGSTDGTSEIVKSIWAREGNGIPLNLVYESKPAQQIGNRSTDQQIGRSGQIGATNGPSLSSDAAWITPSSYAKKACLDPNGGQYFVSDFWFDETINLSIRSMSKPWL